MHRTDHWHCPDCGTQIDLAPHAAEVAMVRLAARGPDGFELGSAGLEPELAAVLEPCACGGRFQPGPGDGPAGSAGLDRNVLRPALERGFALLEAADDPHLAALRDVWRPRLLALLGREAELDREQQLGLRLEAKLQALAEEVERARAAGDDEAAEVAHARYIELGTTYVRRFVARDERASA
jgi:hypothetical protein